MQIKKDFCVFTSVSTPPIPDNDNINIWINIKQFLQKLSYDKTVFPVKEGVMPFAIVKIACHEQVSNALDFLPVRNMIVTSECILQPTIFFYGSLAFLVKRQNNCVFRATC